MKASHNGKREKKDPLVLYTIFPQSWSFPVLLGHELALSVSFQLVSGGGAVELILSCVHLGRCPAPCRVPGSVGAV